MMLERKLSYFDIKLFIAKTNRILITKYQFKKIQVFILLIPNEEVNIFLRSLNSRLGNLVNQDKDQSNIYNNIFVEYKTQKALEMVQYIMIKITTTFRADKLRRPTSRDNILIKYNIALIHYTLYITL